MHSLRCGHSPNSARSVPPSSIPAGPRVPSLLHQPSPPGPVADCLIDSGCAEVGPAGLPASCLALSGDTARPPGCDPCNVSAHKGVDVALPCPHTFGPALPCDTARPPGHSPQPPVPATPSAISCDTSSECLPQLLVDDGSAIGKVSRRWHNEGPDSFIFLEASASPCPPHAGDASSTCSGNGLSSHASAELADECSLSRTDVEELINRKCGVAKVDGDWQQRICSLRQLCRYLDELDDPYIEHNFQCKQSIRELDHSLSKIASLPGPPDPKVKASGSARKKLNRMQYLFDNEARGLIGKDVLRGFIALAEPNTCTNLLQFAAAITTLV